MDALRQRNLRLETSSISQHQPRHATSEHAFHDCRAAVKLQPEFFGTFTTTVYKLTQVRNRTNQSLNPHSPLSLSPPPRPHLPPHFPFPRPPTPTLPPSPPPLLPPLLSNLLSHQLFAGADNGAIRVWDLVSRQLLASLDHHLSAVTALLFSPSATCMASVARDKVGCTWLEKTGTTALAVEVLLITCWEWSPPCALTCSDEKCMCCLRLSSPQVTACTRKSFHIIGIRVAMFPQLPHLPMPGSVHRVATVLACSQQLMGVTHPLSAAILLSLSPPVSAPVPFFLSPPLRW